ncbi:hypothetical protein GS446_24825 [Rhodococcus hoagii]|nr:hypothetical protein [Prescottella equi]
MRELLVIGIGAGDPDQVTIQAVKAMTGPTCSSSSARATRSRTGGSANQHPRRAHGPRLPDRRHPRPTAGPDAVRLHRCRRRLARPPGPGFEEKFAAEDGVGAILVWGDPSLYDSTLRIVERVLARGNVAFDYTVIPGVTSIQALAAQHRIVLNGSASRCTSPPVGSCATAYRTASARPS